MSREPGTTPSTFIRAKANQAAHELAHDISAFLYNCDQFISLSWRYDLTKTMNELEAFSDGR